MWTLNTINLSIYFSMQTFSLLCNCFICLETIINLINPISTMQKRVKFFIILTISLSILMAITVGILEFNCEDEHLNKHYFERLFHKEWAV
jgi:hypothetical protein